MSICFFAFTTWHKICSTSSTIQTRSTLVDICINVRDLLLPQVWIASRSRFSLSNSIMSWPLSTLNSGMCIEELSDKENWKKWREMVRQVVKRKYPKTTLPSNHFSKQSNCTENHFFWKLKSISRNCPVFSGVKDHMRDNARSSKSFTGPLSANTSP